MHTNSNLLNQNDLITKFKGRRTIIESHLRYRRYARANVQAWPQLAGPKQYLAFVEHGLAVAMHQYAGRPAPAPYVAPTAAECQAAYIESVMAIPLARKAA